MSACKLPVLGLRTHREKVKSLYKRSLRNLRCYYVRIITYRIAAVCLRERFDEDMKIKDYMCAKQRLAEGEEELFLFTHYAPMRYQTSFGGVAYRRQVIPPDWVVDYWHPLEKAQYPDYFACREKRKKEYIQLWELLHGDKNRKRAGRDDENKQEEDKIKEDYKCF